MKYLVLIPLLLGCAAELGPNPDAAGDLAPVDDVLVGDGTIAASAIDPSPCPPGWTPDGDACARWRAAAPYPESECWPNPPELGLGLHGGELLRCGERGFWYREDTDTWEEVTPGPSAVGTWLEEVPGGGPSEQRHSAPLWGGQGVLVVTWPFYSIDGYAERWDVFERVSTDTIDPPPGFQADVLLPIAAGRVIAAGAIESAIYERIEAADRQ